ncbi:MAG: hypothetical protein MPW15_14795 [Candidatus Manganitrophus sp.]|nr:hypothetical protein [Candidatus Manganitrophus sp.]
MVENTFSEGAIWTTPLPNASARVSNARSAASADGWTLISPTGSSMVCSLKRSSRGQGATGGNSPSTRRCVKPFPSAHLARSV